MVHSQSKGCLTRNELAAYDSLVAANAERGKHVVSSKEGGGEESLISFRLSSAHLSYILLTSTMAAAAWYH